MNSKQPMSSFFLIPFILCIFLTSITISAFYNDGNVTDHHALMHIKSMITNGALTSWNNSIHFCDWIGVTCWRRRVISIVLVSQGLKGSLSPHVGNLSFLCELFLFNNSLQGTIPHEIGYLSRLQFLNLGNNKFSGVILANISGCSNLERLDLSNNELVGNIPKEIGFLSKLTLVSLVGNNLVGGISPFLGNITSMEMFSVAKNPLGETIPETLGNWKNLKGLLLGGCSLSGTIPHSLYNLSHLSILSLADNQLTSSIPLAIMLPHLVLFELQSNQLTGPLPPFISNCSKLKVLDMSLNKFSGKLTIDFGKLREISFVSLGDNNFRSNEADEMKFIDSLKNCTKLLTLNLFFCKFQGVLPTSIGNLSNQLNYLRLQGNQLHGNLPSSLSNLVGLIDLHLEDNQFIGNIPSTIGNLQKLQAIYFSKNQLSGQIPEAIGNLSSLTNLDLSLNMLEGAIPASLGNCQHLLELYLSSNKLKGNIPRQLLQLSSLSIKLDLSQNNLFGSLPIEIGKLNMLTTMDLSFNKLSGNIPSSLGDCISLSSLYLKGNQFQGMIPPSLISLKALVKLDISANNLSGQIPKFLEQFRLLKYLNLAYNNFEGEVPMLGVFVNASAFSAFGNNKLCGGVVELGLPKCKQTKKHTPKFLLFVIFIFIATTLFTITCLAYAWRKNKGKSLPFQSSMREGFMKVSYNQLLKATNGFSEANLIGKGAFSSVYKGNLDENDDTFVAVKILHLENQRAKRSFTRECEAWRNIRHRNLLKIITSCSSVDFHGNDFKALVYEFMPNGSLHELLHSNESTSSLNLLQILNILIDIASALNYIHNHCIPTIVHGDLKPSNILLDGNMVAHVGDFGLAQFLGTSYPNTSTGIKGTIGYAAPEYGLGNEMTSSGDVYSFGILLLEVMTRKKPTDDIFNEGLSLHKFASMALPDHVTNVIDLNILNVYQEDESFMQHMEENVKKVEECVASIVKIGVLCTAGSPQERMDMKHVVLELQHILDKLQNI